MKLEYLLGIKNLILSDQFTLRGAQIPSTVELINAVDKEIAAQQQAAAVKQQEAIKDAVKRELELGKEFSVRNELPGAAAD